MKPTTTAQFTDTEQQLYDMVYQWGASGALTADTAHTYHNLLRGIRLDGEIAGLERARRLLGGGAERSDTDNNGRPRMDGKTTAQHIADGTAPLSLPAVSAGKTLEQHAQAGTDPFPNHQDFPERL